MRTSAQDSRSVIFVFHYKSRSGPPHTISTIDAASAWKLVAGLTLGPSVMRWLLLAIAHRGRRIAHASGMAPGSSQNDA